MDRDALAARLRASFLGELDEQVQAMTRDLLALERDPGDAEHLRALFRVAHTLKGAARAAGVMPIERTCHALESLLAPVRDGGHLAPDDFALLYAAVDALAAASGRLRDNTEPDEAALTALRDALRARSLGAAPAQSAGQPAPPRPDSAPAPLPPVDPQVRIEAEKLDALLDAAGELLVTAARFEERPAALERLTGLMSRRAVDWSRTDRRLRMILEAQPANTDVLEALQAMRDHLQQASRDVAQLAEEIAADTRLLEQNAAVVAGGVQRLRLRPFAEAAESLPRVARDVAAAASKEVTLTVDGGSVEADRAVLDGLRDALVQLVRNAVDHGIESPVLRLQAGKPQRGRIEVRARMQGDRLVVDIRDDGAGLDLDAVRDTLRRRGAPIPADDQELARVLFNPGISTRREVGTISGRGVGLDIVRAAMQRIRGNVEVAWSPGQGTTFTLECPNTLATFRALLVRAGEQLVALPTSHVERLIRLPVREIRRAEGRLLLSTVDGPVPLVPLSHLLPPLPRTPLQDPLTVVLLASGTRRLGVMVEELVAEQPVVLRPIRHQGEALPLVGGAAILGRGHVALVLNASATIDAGLIAGPPPDEMLAGAEPGGPVRPRVLVVDDSITTRTLEQSILETAGYDVLIAVDGADGWRVLQERGADLIVSDIEMPRMDGFALCEAVRASARFRATPVILVTALETAEHRARGMAAGADAYIGKSSFDQKNLLTTVHQLLGRETT